MDQQKKSNQGTASNIEELPVKLVFELGRLDFTLGELKCLSPGAVVPLSRPMSEAFDIVANGKRIGSGTLVKIGDSIGARITRIFDLE